jgi:ubiquinone/menaquinone biosynthesis C-methylase UbiE
MQSFSSAAPAPSLRMIAHRVSGHDFAVGANAEPLPFEDNTFNVVMAMSIVHP